MWVRRRPLFRHFHLGQGSRPDRAANAQASRKHRRRRRTGPMPHTLLFTFLRYATGNVFRPTKSHAGQTTTQQEGGTDRSDQPEYQESLSVSSCLETSSCAQRAQQFQVQFLMFFSPPQVNFTVSFRTIKGENCNTLAGIIAVMMGDIGRGHCVSCQGPPW